MKLENHVLNELHAFRYTGDDPRYALVISHELGGHGGGATNTAFLSDAVSLASIDRQGQLHFWDLMTGRRLSNPIRAHRGASWRISASAMNNAFVTSGDDRTIRVWDILSEFRACEIGAPGFDAPRKIEYFGEGEHRLTCMEAAGQ